MTKPRYLEPERLVYTHPTFVRTLQQAQVDFPGRMEDFAAFHDSALNPVRAVTEVLKDLPYPDWLPVLPFLKSGRLPALTLRQYHALVAYGAALDEQKATLWHMIVSYALFEATRTNTLPRLAGDSRAFLKKARFPVFTQDAQRFSDDTHPLESGDHHFTLRISKGAAYLNATLNNCVVLPEWLRGNTTPPTAPTDDYDRTLRDLGLDVSLSEHFEVPVHRRQEVIWPSELLADNAVHAASEEDEVSAVCKLTPAFRKQLNAILTKPRDPTMQKPFAAWATQTVRYAESALHRLGYPNMPTTRDMAVVEALESGDPKASEAMRLGPNFFFRCQPPDLMTVVTQAIAPDDPTFGFWLPAIAPERLPRKGKPCRIRLEWGQQELEALDVHGTDARAPL